MPSTDRRIQKRGPRGRGAVRQHHGGYQVRVTAGKDPVTGERLMLQGSAPTLREAEKLRTKLLADADNYRAARTRASLGYLLARWLPQHDVDETTRKTYASLITYHIEPALGSVSLMTLVRRATETLETFYADLRRCRDRCDGRMLIEHAAGGEHDCVAAGCRPHRCRPLAASSVRQIHAILSGACSAAVRWGWMPFNPSEAARQPSKPRPDPQLPTPAEAARIVEEATRQDPEWGLHVWLAIVTGARRGELCALRWRTAHAGPGRPAISPPPSARKRSLQRPPALPWRPFRLGDRHAIGRKCDAVCPCAIKHVRSRARPSASASIELVARASAGL